LLRGTRADIGQLTQIDATPMHGWVPECRRAGPVPSTALIWDGLWQTSGDADISR
jgi:hypothetical protein